MVETAGTAGPSTSASTLPGRTPAMVQTPIGLMNNGVNVTDGNTPTIWHGAPVQVLSVNSSGRGAVKNSSRPPPGRGAPEAGSYERIFGQQPQIYKETTSKELGRLSIFTMRQLQRAMQQKILQSTRDPMGVWNAFHKLDRRNCGELNFADLQAAVKGFNLIVSDDLVKELLRALDSDHDGVLSLTEFVAGLKADNNSALQLQPDQSHNVSSRRYFRCMKYHHPLHNLAHLSPLHQFEENPQF